MAIVTRFERKSRRWEQVWQGDSEAIATIVAGRLQSEGVRTRVHGSTTPYRATALALGGSWAILVPAGHASDARTLLRDNGEAHNLIDFEDAAGLTSSQRSTMRAVVAAVVVLAAVILAAVLTGRA